MKANEAQEADAWRLARVGCFTASRAGDLMAQGRSGPSASRGALLALLAVERITGLPVETYSNAAMQRGVELEAEARDAYSFQTGAIVDDSGFIDHPAIEWCGCSPDGMVGDLGLVEIKCPANMAKHVDALLRGAHATEYHWQLHHQLMVTGRQWVDAVSYDPRFPADLQIAIKRVYRSAEAIASLERAIADAEAEVCAIVESLQSIRGRK